MHFAATCFNHLSKPGLLKNSKEALEVFPGTPHTFLFDLATNTDQVGIRKITRKVNVLVTMITKTLLVMSMMVLSMFMAMLVMMMMMVLSIMIHPPGRSSKTGIGGKVPKSFHELDSAGKLPAPGSRDWNLGTSSSETYCHFVTK